MSGVIKIGKGGLEIGYSRPIFVVAEIGKGFIQTEEDQTPEVYLANAKELVKLAKEAGANAVKFQTHTVEDEQANVNVVAPHFKGADRYNWVKRNTEAAPIWFWRELKKYCDDIGIVFFSTPMSRGAAQLLNQVGVDLWKVGSGDLLDFVMLDYIVSTGKPIIISAGMSTLEETDLAVDFLKRRSANFALMHCVSKYPCPPEDLQLQTIKFFADRYNIPIGFSDHSIGVDSAIAAVALGAAIIIEKHFSKSRELWGSDHKVALTPAELKMLVAGIREVESDPEKKKEYLNKEIVRAGLGQSVKVLQEGEDQFRPFFRKTLVALADIPAGAAITADMVGAMRPQAHLAGLPSEKFEEVVGKTLLRSLKKYEPISQEVMKS